jgi:hypothetical protein
MFNAAISSELALLYKVKQKSSLTLLGVLATGSAHIEPSLNTSTT